MNLQDCTRILAPLGVMLGADIDEPTYRAYFRALEDVPIGLLAAAADRAAKSCRFRCLPTPGELREYAEDARKALLKAHPFLSCGSCSDQGWTEREIDGVKRQVRCRCWSIHQERIAALGAGTGTLIALTAAEVTE